MVSGSASSGGGVRPSAARRARTLSFCFDRRPFLDDEEGFVGVDDDEVFDFRRLEGDASTPSRSFVARVMGVSPLVVVVVEGFAGVPPTEGASLAARLPARVVTIVLEECGGDCVGGKYL